MKVENKIIHIIKKGMILFLFIILVFACEFQGIDEGENTTGITDADRSGQPDFTVIISHTYAELVIGQYETFKAFVINSGTAASATAVLKFQIGGSVTFHSIPVLQPGGHFSVCRTVHFDTAGTYLVTAIADVYNTVAESNETNNTKQITIPVKDYGKPDLYISTLTYAGTPKVGNFMNFIIQVKNNLFCGMSPATRVNVRIGGETFGQFYNIPALAPGQGYNLSRGWTPSVAGNFRITAVADADNDASEKSESNNTKYISVQVTN
ncbi:MAG: hypothetical protein JXB88_20890 [Spirochaetales bacterium]|nr:hypothetical protein [Spirochaetales bacterium]